MKLASGLKAQEKRETKGKGFCFRTMGLKGRETQLRSPQEEEDYSFLGQPGEKMPALYWRLGSYPD